MSHFFSPLQISKSSESGFVRLSIRTSDDRVDEHTIPEASLWEMVDKQEDSPSDWEGTEALKVKFSHPLVSLSIRVSDTHRVIYRFDYRHFSVFVSHCKALKKI